YSMRDDAATALACLDLGAFTYLNKAEGHGHLVAAVYAADVDRAYVSPSLAGAMGVDQRPNRPRLAAREVDVLLEWFKCESNGLGATAGSSSPACPGCCCVPVGSCAATTAKADHFQAFADLRCALLCYRRLIKATK